MTPRTGTLTVRSPRDLLAYVPYRLGYEPHDSAVVVSLLPPRHQVGLVVRADLADLADPRGGAGLARTIATHAARDGADGVVVVVYAQDAGRAAAGLATLEPALEEGHDVRDRWLVTPTGYRSLDCDDPACCPPDGRPVHELSASPLAARLVYEGVVVAPSREHAHALPPVGPAARRAARRAADRFLAARPHTGAAFGVVHDGVPDPGAGWRLDGYRAWGSLLAAVRRAHEAEDVRPGAPGLPGAAAAGRVAAALSDVRVRDAALLSLVPGAQEAARRLLAAATPADDDGVGAAVGVVVDPVDGIPPDPATCVPARTALELVAAHARRREQAAPLTLLGFLAWWEGDGGLARARLSAALEADPGYRLGGLLLEAVDAGLPPGWVRRAGRASGSV